MRNLILAVDLLVSLKNGFFSVLYWIFDKLCFILDFCQSLVRKLVGLDTIYYNGTKIDGQSGGSVTSDLVEIIIKTDVIRNIFISLLVLGIILLFITTFIAVWKTEWNFDKEGNSKTKVINASLKALFNFIAVPVIALFGIFVGNALLRAIDGATSGGASEIGMSRLLFSSMSTNAVRNIDDSFVKANLKTEVITIDGEEKTVNGIFLLFKGTSTNDIHEEDILEAFKTGFVLKGTSTIYQIFDDDEISGLSASSIASLNNKLQKGEEIVFSYDNTDLVKIFFDLSKMNFILAYLILIFMLKAMLEITFGLIKRIFNVVILFVISPPIVAITPINDKPLKEWTSIFVKNLLMAYTTIAIYNVFISIYPLFEKIALFPKAQVMQNYIISLFMICVGLMTLNELVKTISEILGWKGFDLNSQSTDKGKSLWGGAFGMAGSALKPLAAPVAIGKGIANFATNAKYTGLGNAVKQAALSGASAVANNSLVKSFTDGAGIKFKSLSAEAEKKRKEKLEKQVETGKQINVAPNNAKKDAEIDLQDAGNSLGYTGLDARNKQDRMLAQDSAYYDIKANDDYKGMQEYLEKKKRYQELQNQVRLDRNQRDELKNIKNYFDGGRGRYAGKTTAEYFEQDTLKEKYKAQQSYIDAYEIKRDLEEGKATSLAREENGVHYKKGSGQDVAAKKTKSALTKQQAKNKSEEE